MRHSGVRPGLQSDPVMDSQNRLIPCVNVFFEHFPCEIGNYCNRRSPVDIFLQALQVFRRFIRFFPGKEVQIVNCENYF